MVLAAHCFCGDNVKYGPLSKHLFKKNSTIWRFKKSERNDKLLQNIMPSSYHMESKTFMETSCIHNIDSGEKFFATATFEGL